MSLNLSDLINVSVQLSPQAAQSGTNFGSLLLLGASSVIDVNERIRKYSTLDQVASDFGTTAPEYLAADAFFSQNPQPNTLYIGRVATTASNGLLHGGILSASAQALSNFTAVSAGSMAITIDGTAKTVSALDLSAVTNLNGVASALTTALSSAATVTWNASLGRFDVVSSTTGATSTVSFASPTGSGTDVSALLGLTAATGAKTVNGIAAETMVAGLQAIVAKNSDFYGVAIAAASPSDADVLAVAAYAEGSNPHRLFVVTTSDSNTLDPSSTSDLASQLQALKYNHTAVQYSSSSPYAAVSLFARQASVDFVANNSTITLMFKSEPGIAPETLTETQAAALKAKNCNVFVNYSNSTAIIQFGTVASGQYIDTITGTDWILSAVQVAVFNQLYTSPSKLAQSDAGVNLLITTVDSVMDQAVSNGLMAPGVWSGPAIGPLQTGQTLSKGYFVYAAPIATQSASDRAARVAPVIQVAAHLAGAIHEANVVINVAQ